MRAPELRRQRKGLRQLLAVAAMVVTGTAGLLGCDEQEPAEAISVPAVETRSIDTEATQGAARPIVAVDGQAELDPEGIRRRLEEIDDELAWMVENGHLGGMDLDIEATRLRAMLQELEAAE